REVECEWNQAASRPAVRDRRSVRGCLRREMKAHLTRRYKFSASHRLHSPELSDQQNRETYGKCNNPYGHGHNYKVEVTVSGEPDPETGMICNLADLDGFVDRELLRRFAFSNLNELDIFRNQ